MISIYKNDEGLFALEIFTCEKTTATPVDHLHFVLRLHYNNYEELYEGEFGIEAGPVFLEKALEKITAIYLTQAQLTKNRQIQNGSSILQ